MYKRKYSAAKSRIEKKKRRKFLLLSQNQLVATRLVVAKWLNFAKCVDVIPVKMCFKSC